MISMTIDAKNLFATLDSRARKMKDATIPLKEIGIRMGNWTLETFKNEGVREGHSKWKRLEDSTANARFRIATSKKERASGFGKTKGRKAYTVYEKFRDKTGKLIKQKRVISNKRGTQNILHPVGTLMKSFKVMKVSANELQYGSKLKVGKGLSLGAIHQLGLGNNPVREILFYTKRDEKEINTAFTRWFSK